MEDQGHHERNCPGDQCHPKILDDRDDAIIAAEFAGDGHQARRAPGHERQRAGQRADVAVQTEQSAGEDAEQQCGHGDHQHDQPVRSERTDGVLMDHRADVDAQHTLGDHPRRARHLFRGERDQRQHDAYRESGEQGGRGHVDEGERDGDGDGRDEKQRPPQHPCHPRHAPPTEIIRDTFVIFTVQWHSNASIASNTKV